MPLLAPQCAFFFTAKSTKTNYFTTGMFLMVIGWRPLTRATGYTNAFHSFCVLMVCWLLMATKPSRTFLSTLLGIWALRLWKCMGIYCVSHGPHSMVHMEFLIESAVNLQWQCEKKDDDVPETSNRWELLPLLNPKEQEQGETLRDQDSHRGGHPTEAMAFRRGRQPLLTTRPAGQELERQTSWPSSSLSPLSSANCLCRCQRKPKARRPMTQSLRTAFRDQSRAWLERQWRPGSRSTRIHSLLSVSCLYHLWSRCVMLSILYQPPNLSTKKRSS